MKKKILLIGFFCLIFSVHDINAIKISYFKIEHDLAEGYRNYSSLYGPRKGGFFRSVSADNIIRKHILDQHLTVIDALPAPCDMPLGITSDGSYLYVNDSTNSRIEAQGYSGQIVQEGNRKTGNDHCPA